MKMSKISDENIISLDEIAVYLNEKPTHGWSKKGTECIIKSKNKQIINTTIFKIYIQILKIMI